MEQGANTRRSPWIRQNETVSLVQNAYAQKKWKIKGARWNCNRLLRPSPCILLHSWPSFSSNKKHGQGSASTRGPSAGSGSRKIQGAQKIAQTIASENPSVSQIGAPKNAIVYNINNCICNRLQSSAIVCNRLQSGAIGLQRMATKQAPNTLYW